MGEVSARALVLVGWVGLGACGGTDFGGPIAEIAPPGWNDGKAEVAFYRVTWPKESFVAGTYLVEHDFDPRRETKADQPSGRTVPSFKWALFYEHGTASEQFKRSYVINVTRASLRPLKASLNSFDWCSNRYEEMSFHPGGSADLLVRSDDYGNDARRLSGAKDALPAAAIPLLARSLVGRHELHVLLPDGKLVGATAELDGQVATASDAADRVVLRYERAFPAPWIDQTDTEEVYLRGPAPDRALLRFGGKSGRYTLELIEKVRSAYWKEDVFKELQRVKVRP